jgi:hypothetical protein
MVQKATVAGVLDVVAGISGLVGGIPLLALAGSIAAVFGFFPLGIAAVIFTILAEPEFRSEG